MAEPMHRQLPLPLGHGTAFGAEDFLVAPSNRAAADLVGRWPDWPRPVLVLIGASGSGKTHLAEVWRVRANAMPILLEETSVENVLDIVQSAPNILIDDADRLAGISTAERNLFHLYNAVLTRGGSLLLTGCRPPSEWSITLPDLESRLRSAPVATLLPPDDELLAAVALKLFTDRQLQVDADVISVLINLGERSFAGIGWAVEALDRTAMAQKRPITATMARRLLTGVDSAAD